MSHLLLLFLQKSDIYYLYIFTFFSAITTIMHQSFSRKIKCSCHSMNIQDLECIEMAIWPLLYIHEKWCESNISGQVYILYVWKDSSILLIFGIVAQITLCKISMLLNTYIQISFYVIPGIEIIFQVNVLGKIALRNCRFL